jgi:Fis family transcriptional regulator, factor for inversion stimulation protein
MTLQGTPHVRQPAGIISVARKPAPDPLSERVRESLEHYFKQLDGTDASDLYQLVISQVERPLFESVMQHTGGNQTRAAMLLGISRATLRKKLALYDIL